MRITVNTQSSIRIESGKVFYFDPLEISGQPHDADMVFITHEHYDHFSPEDIKKVSGPDTVYVLPESMSAQAKTLGGKAVLLAPKGKAEVLGYEVEGVPAYNINKHFHVRERGWLGYIVAVEGKRIYVVGDSDCTPEMVCAQCDAILLPIGGHYTMDLHEAAEGVRKMNTSCAIPTHYGTIVGKKDDGKTFRKELGDAVRVVLPLEGEECVL